MAQDLQCEAECQCTKVGALLLTPLLVHGQSEPPATATHNGAGKGILLGLGSPSRTPYTWRAPRRAGLSLPPLYTWAGGTPKALQDLT